MLIDKFFFFRRKLGSFEADVGVSKRVDDVRGLPRVARVIDVLYLQVLAEPLVPIDKTSAKHRVH